MIHNIYAWYAVHNIYIHGIHYTQFLVKFDVTGVCDVSMFVYCIMDDVIREVNVRVLGKGLELLSTNGGRFEIN